MEIIEKKKILSHMNQEEKKLRIIGGYITYGMNIENNCIHVVYMLQRYLLCCRFQFIRRV